MLVKYIAGWFTYNVANCKYFLYVESKSKLKPTKGVGGQSVKPVFIDLTDNAGGVLEPTNWRVCEL